MKRIPATPARSVDPAEMTRRLAEIARRDRETSERARDTKAKSALTVRQVRALRYAKTDQDLATLEASLKGLRYRLSVHDEALAELDARLTRLEAARLLRLQKGNPVL